ncbi:precorrin-6y C5,15-methyltransferase (decarboxylating) subunit CbiE [Pelagibaculum spongiae]|uniref:Bifunctional cobalt-precorrin-7 (C(5))-methyltransferase/cobalt-precorrin-6B (C(15))-methyltransferase n=1 Tax=Pelagibaculum spongiae TaxID=2080658 RepID=A0A2V1H680_9GAMM|nr:precorrin-6y C5,15-methyltransferase (decarboxylating) subunit CbiE [Pelagibaculum spongiae]PVZ72265.1 bifunctional cobalt-precorrin-7 (C(5))-methyltransferase/cobalt-precorrin-6B (C(15))-methyltransferase [Pelagibaculum spongiae]
MALITLIGVPEDGCNSLSSKAVNAACSARVLAGHSRLMQWFPQFNGKKLLMDDGYKVWLDQLIDEAEEGDIAVLASGDPLFFGIGDKLDQLFPGQLKVIPSPSSMQLACSRLVLPWQNCRAISLHGRPLKVLVSRMQQNDLFAILTDTKNTPQIIARHLLQFNQADWQLTVCQNLGGQSEQVDSFSVGQLASVESDFSGLNIVIAKRNSSKQKKWSGQGQYAQDDQFAKRMPKKGLITNRSVRHLALTEMQIQPEHCIWDVGAGSGSVGIEAAKQAWQGEVFSIEANSQCYEGIEANRLAHATDNLQLIKGMAPDALINLPRPNAVFIGGSRGAMNRILDVCWQRLLDDGVIIATAVTLDSVSELFQWAKKQNIQPQVQLINVSYSAPLAHYIRYQAENPIHLFSFSKEVDNV